MTEVAHRLTAEMLAEGSWVPRQQALTADWPAWLPATRQPESAAASLSIRVHLPYLFRSITGEEFEVSPVTLLVTPRVDLGTLDEETREQVLADQAALTDWVLVSLSTEIEAAGGLLTLESAASAPTSHDPHRPSALIPTTNVDADLPDRLAVLIHEACLVFDYGPDEATDDWAEPA